MLTECVPVTIPATLRWHRSDPRAVTLELQHSQPWMMAWATTVETIRDAVWFANPVEYGEILFQHPPCFRYQDSDSAYLTARFRVPGGFAFFEFEREQLREFVDAVDACWAPWLDSETGGAR